MNTIEYLKPQCDSRRGPLMSLDTTPKARLHSRSKTCSFEGLILHALDRRHTSHLHPFLQPALDEPETFSPRTPEHLVTRSFRVTTFTFGLLSGYSPVTFGLLSGYLVVTWWLPCGYHLVTRRSQSGCGLVALQLGLLRSDVPLVVCCC